MNAKVGQTHRHDERRCPRCGYLVDASTSLSDNPSPPEPGDITICVNCHTILLFSERLTLRTPTAAELKELQDGPEWEAIEQTRNALRVIRVSRPSS